ncbi:MAG TPA: DUF4832 domain-containing protein [Ornithinibacter sp.]|nr:DUF4832 domain-containing protein [Ornithinibacter sp.]
MNASARRRLAAALIAVATTAAVALTSFVAADSATAATAAPATKTFSKSVWTPSTDLANPLRGQYQWMGYPSQLSDPWQAPTDVYYRDQTYWGKLERTKGAYDFSSIEAGLKKAGDAKGKFGFRVVAYCPGCWMEMREDQTAFPPVTPTYLPVQPGTGTVYGPNKRLISTVPDWNNETFLARWEALWAELGRRYANDPRLGYVDVGGYGKFGEWWVDGAAVHITDANGLRMIKAVASAFPTKHVLINTMSPVKFTMAAITANPNLGIRTDSLGCPNMYSMVTDTVDTRLSEVWKTRPFYSEWGTSGDPVAGKGQVTKWHVSTTSSENMRLKYAAMTPTQQAAFTTAIRSAGYRYAVTKVTVGPLVRGKASSVTTAISNLGSAPTYDGWSVQLWLINSKGQKTWAKALSVDPRKILPGSKTITTKFTVPTTLPRGTYTATIAVVDRLKYSAPMYLSNYSRRADGSYTLGSVVTG